MMLCSVFWGFLFGSNFRKSSFSNCPFVSNSFFGSFGSSVKQECLIEFSSCKIKESSLCSVTDVGTGF